jgi:hypothetical protein
MLALRAKVRRLQITRWQFTQIININRDMTVDEGINIWYSSFYSKCEASIGLV